MASYELTNSWVVTQEALSDQGYLYEGGCDICRQLGEIGDTYNIVTSDEMSPTPDFGSGNEVCVCGACAAKYV